MTTHIHHVVRITAVLKQSAYRRVMAALHNSGIDHLHLETGREPVLEERRGLRALLTGGDTLSSEPVLIISFFVPRESEDSFLKIVATEGHLQIPGMGILFSEESDLFQTRPLCHPGKPEWPSDRSFPLLGDVAGLQCIVQRGEGDRIARAILEAGFAVPTITFARGMGLRDRLGLLRITIPAEKEVLTLITAAHDREAAMELMIEEGKIDRPGRGMIHTFPVRKAILNTRIMRGGRTHAASMEQIVTALDSIKGNMEWRMRGMGMETTDFKKRNFILQQNEIQITCDEGNSRDIVYTAMNAGVHGATIHRARFIDTGVDPELEHVTLAREIISMSVPAPVTGSILQSLEDSGVLELGSHATIHTRPVPHTLTFRQESRPPRSRTKLRPASKKVE